MPIRPRLPHGRHLGSDAIDCHRKIRPRPQKPEENRDKEKESTKRISNQQNSRRKKVTFKLTFASLASDASTTFLAGATEASPLKAAFEEADAAEVGRDSRSRLRLFKLAVEVNLDAPA
jgi:hypothetical protein